jgi:PAS domain S-box-containing protein
MTIISSRMLKNYLWMNLPFSGLLGVLFICWHLQLITSLTVILWWVLLSILSLGGGVWGLVRLGASSPQAGQKPSEPASESLLCNVDTAMPTSELVDRQSLFDVFMDHLPALAFIKDRKGRYLYINSACNEMLKRVPEDMIGRTDCDLWPADQTKFICLNDAQVITGNQVYSAIETVMVDDELRHHMVTKFGIRNDGRPPLLGGIAFDVTEKVRAQEERAELEQQLIQSQKMEAIGTLAGGIAHDFNNVLAAIMGYVELALFDASHGSKVREELEQVLKAAHRATDLVRQILTFSRKTGQERQPLDPKPLVSEALKMIRATLPTTIEIRQYLNVQGAKVMANPTQLHQVIMNICTNAAHAMEENGGILEVRLGKRQFTGAQAGRRGVTPGDYLLVRISDTGHGIAPALQQRIFDPYFTTKAQGKGTGMGLAVARGIVQSHGGAIRMESEVDKGACFEILFPVTTVLTTSSSDKKVSLPSGTESILFVDDEPVLTELGKQMLTRLGYRVTVCQDPTQALELFHKDPYQFNLVIADITMPKMTGDILAAQILEIRSDIPVFLCTGYSEQMTHEKASQIGIAAFLMKPLSISDLAFSLRRTLDEQGSKAITRRLKVVQS